MSSVLNDASADAAVRLGTRYESYDEARSATPPTVEVHEALAIGLADGLRAYEQLHHYEIEIFLEKDGWHIYFGIKQRNGSRVAGGGPHYVIDADTGEILSKKYYQ